MAYLEISLANFCNPDTGRKQWHGRAWFALLYDRVENCIISWEEKGDTEGRPLRFHRLRNNRFIQWIAAIRNNVLSLTRSYPNG